MSDPALQMDADALHAFLEEVFPQALTMGFEIARVDTDGVMIALDTDHRHLRPGGTVMGPTLMTLADTAVYLAILSRVGPKALAVTTSLEMHFLHRPPPGRLEATGRLRKLGTRLAVGSVSIRSVADGREVGLATVTYSLPPR